MSELDVFYDINWEDFQDKIDIKKVLKSETLSEYFVKLPNETIKVRFDDQADQITKLWNHTVDIPTCYPREWYVYIVNQIAELRMCSKEEVMDLLFYLNDFIDSDENDGEN